MQKMFSSFLEPSWGHRESSSAILGKPWSFILHPFAISPLFGPHPIIIPKRKEPTFYIEVFRQLPASVHRPPPAIEVIPNPPPVITRRRSSVITLRKNARPLSGTTTRWEGIHVNSLIRAISIAAFKMCSKISPLFALPNKIKVRLIVIWLSFRKKGHILSAPRNNEPNLMLFSSKAYIPYPEKRNKGGGDSYFIYEFRDKYVLGVAGGVEGWARYGVDARRYALELMGNSSVAVDNERKGSIDPMRVLREAYFNIEAQGSSTACIVAINNQTINAVNIGHTGFLLIRNDRIIFRSPTQLHSFNIPYQLRSVSGDLPSAAMEFAIPVENGDIVVAGTGGLFDNLYDEEILSVVVCAHRRKLGPTVAAEEVASLAYKRARNSIRQSPYAVAADEAGYCYEGGKPDEITVIVSFIIPAFLVRE